MMKPIYEIGTARQRAMHKRFASRVGATCVHCDKLALYRVGQKGYCQTHRNKAVAHLKNHVQAAFDSNERAGRTKPLDEWT